MASYAGGYGAGGAVDALKDLIAQRFMERRQSEVERAQRSEETFRQQEMAAAQERAQRNEILAREDATERKRQFEVSQKQHQDDLREQRITRTMESQKQAMEHADDAAAGLEGEDRAAKRRAEEIRANQAFQIYMDDRRARREGAAGGGPAAELAQVKLQAEKDKLAREEKDRQDIAATKTRERSDLVDLVTSIRDHPELAANVGAADAYTPTFRSGSKDFQAKLAQLTAALSLENRAKLKGQGTISNYEAGQLAQAATSLNAGTDEATFKKELNRILTGLGGNAASQTVRLQAPDGTLRDVPAAQAQYYIGRGAKPVQ